MLRSAGSLTQPSMNSTARISKQLFDLKERQFDAAAAVAEELEQSEMKRLALAEKVSLSVNVRKEETKYSGLIPVNVEEEALLRKCAPSRAPLSSTVDKRPASIDPDIMEFFSDTFVEETAGLDFDIFDQVEAPVGPSPAPLSHTFGLYSHMQMWQPTGKARTKWEWWAYYLMQLSLARQAKRRDLICFATHNKSLPVAKKLNCLYFCQHVGLPPQREIGTSCNLDGWFHVFCTEWPWSLPIHVGVLCTGASSHSRSCFDFLHWQEIENNMLCSQVSLQTWTLGWNEENQFLCQWKSMNPPYPSNFVSNEEHSLACSFGCAVQQTETTDFIMISLGVFTVSPLVLGRVVRSPIELILG